ncbi:MAG: hypothetical protein LUE64_05035, partial [Candidatus Gastranaerophilales bacterium]|nr:hypothetical protein [Candidatus Gastranaerophilales bacterium]
NGKNTEGSDRFRFLYCPNTQTSWLKTGQVIPYQLKSTKTRAQALALCKDSGIYCTGLLFFDNWEFKKDYPYKI